MESISTFDLNKESQRVEYQVSSIELFKDSDFSEEFDFSESILKDWLPGIDIYLKLKIAGIVSSDVNIIASWYCPSTHFRGVINNLNRNEAFRETKLSGVIDGMVIRDKINLTILVLNKEGFIVDSIFKTKLILEGKRSYFPIGESKFPNRHADAVCSLELSVDTHPDEIFSQSVCRALFNTESELFDKKEGQLKSYLPIKYFIKYEIWRQKLEIALSNENFNEFTEPSDSEDTRIGVIWSSILKEIFPGMDLDQIRNLRKNNYSDFCASIQAKFFSGLEGYL